MGKFRSIEAFRRYEKRGAGESPRDRSLGARRAVPEAERPGGSPLDLYRRLRETPGGLTREEGAARLGWSRGAVDAAVLELLGAGLVTLEPDGAQERIVVRENP